ncbi:flavin reductase family protein [Chloroflexus sp.]|uniref:flavin reductase family protein n=1 Tax=Chloroflexus sp. TaxID=1904827 RepID=UPI002ACEB774|nr:flavin reductase family protein [Chloroflexus sp.]
MTIDPRDYRATMGLFATGVTVITASDGEQIRGMTANSLTSVSLDPLLLLVCVDRKARMAPVIAAATHFAVNILRVDQEAIARHFAGRPQPNLEIPLAELAGAPILSDSLATLVCTRDRILDGGDHLIVLGRVVALRRAPEGEPLLYFAGAYRQLAEVAPALA